MSEKRKLSKFAKDIRNCQRKAVGKAITLIESTRDDDRVLAEQLISELLPHTGHSKRLGITGAPGVGKSTFIETFGLALIDKGHRVAVLAIDPSSPNTGGSILGDKTRMEYLSKKHEAFIRPSPTSGRLGGIAARTREAMFILEAAGFDIVIIETVGVGQSEIAVSNLTDVFILLIAPAAGDDLQGIKRGIIELSDLIIINKADGELLPIANKTESDYDSALQVLRNKDRLGTPKIAKCSALMNTGIMEIGKIIDTFYESAEQTGVLQKRRASQDSKWMWEEIHELLTFKLKSDKKLSAVIKKLESRVESGKTSSTSAARTILESMLK